MPDVVKKLSPTHEQMVEWVLQNPGGRLVDMSAYFDGYSISWLSQICNSDMFKAALAERLGEIRAVVTLSIPKRMEALAAQACERMEEVLTNSTDPEILVESFDKVMHRYGYAPGKANPATGTGSPGAVIGQQNNFYLTQEEFQRNRERLINSHQPHPEALPAQVEPEKV